METFEVRLVGVLQTFPAAQRILVNLAKLNNPHPVGRFSQFSYIDEFATVYYPTDLCSIERGA